MLYTNVTPFPVSGLVAEEASLNLVYWERTLPARAVYSLKERGLGI